MCQISLHKPINMLPSPFRVNAALRSDPPATPMFPSPRSFYDSRLYRLASSSSCLVTQGLKLAINLLNSKDVDEAFRAHINVKMLRFGLLGSSIGSVMGCLFLMPSMVNMIEIRLGMLSCGSQSTINTVASMIILVTSILLVYISTDVYAFLHWIASTIVNREFIFKSPSSAAT